ncbi:GON-4-like protein isoform X2 [Asterias amurensis]|uniref:GON-4-like protein isoform X2 n=1 Tax=Asterias amurensis TaxID=7602 RepID=UPI003AB1E623
MADTSKRKRRSSSSSSPECEQDPASKRSRLSPDIPGEISSGNVVSDSTVEKTASNPHLEPAISKDGVKASGGSDDQRLSSVESVLSDQEQSTQIVREAALEDSTSEQDFPKAVVSVDDDACPPTDVQNVEDEHSNSDTSPKELQQSSQDSSHECSRKSNEEYHTTVGEDRKSTDNVNNESTHEKIPDSPRFEGTNTSMASLDTVDMEAVQALTFLKQSASPTKVLSGPLSNQGNSDTRLYTGSIRRKGFAKGSLAKQKLKKNSQKKLTPVRSDETDSEGQQEGFSSSPSRMVIDMQPTRKSARQAAQEDKEKPWSAMMKKKAKKKLGRMFEAGGERKETRGRKKGSKGPSLDADEVQRANEACDLLEKRLEENAVKNNLSVVNVKNILHHVITNEHVLAMVRNTMDDGTPGDNIKSPSSPAVVFEPKMTRSKLKEVSEKSGNMGNVPFVWPVSPIKKSKQVPQFTDLMFSDSDDDDEDYKPSQEDLQKDESDYESITSFGSPCPSTPRSSLNTSFFEDTEEEGDVESAPPHSPLRPPSVSPSPAKGGHLRAVPVPMGPPPPKVRFDNKIKDDAKFLKQLDEVNMELEKSEDTIAHRTRSKFPIDIPLEEIEASFVAPDITADMFDTWDDCEDDNEWVRWLAGLQKTTDPEVSDVGDDDQNDPEYNFLAEEEAVDEEDFRNDKTVEITKKEVNELLDELIDAFENEDWAADFDMQHFDKPQQLTLSDMIAQRQMTYPKDGKGKKNVQQQQSQQQQQQQVMVFNHHERMQLQQQMQQHVQLLCQLNLLCRGSPAMEPHKNQAKQFLSELDMLAGRSEETVLANYMIVGVQQPYGPCSAFRPCNLAGALAICEQEFVVTEKELAIMNAHEAWKTVANETTRSKSHTIRSPPTEGAQNIIAHSRVFMYSELLPTVSLTEKPLQKIHFEKAEDRLILLGLMQYPLGNDRQSQYRLICQNMLPIKTNRQVMIHVKNMCCKKRNSDNIIRRWRKHNIMPDLSPLCAPILPGTEQSPVEQSQIYDKKPEWLKKLMYQAGFFPPTTTATETPATPSCSSSTPPPPVQQLQPPGDKPHTLTNTVITVRSIPTPLALPKRAILPKVGPQTTQGTVSNSTSKAAPSETDSSSPKSSSEGPQRPSTMLTQSCRIAPKALSCVTLQGTSANQPVLMLHPQQGVLNTIRGNAVQIITTTGGFTPVKGRQGCPSPSFTLLNSASDTKSPDTQTLTSTLRSRSKVSPTSVTPSGISALSNFKVRRLDNVSPEPPPEKDLQCHEEDNSSTNISKRQSESFELEKKSASRQKVRPSTLKGHSRSAFKISSSLGQNKKEPVSESNSPDAMKQPDSTKSISSSTASARPATQSATTSTTVTKTDKKCSNTLSESVAQKELPKPPSRSKSQTPDSLPGEEEDEDTTSREVVSPVDVLESGNSNSQDFVDAVDRPDGPQSLAQGEGETEEMAEELEKTMLNTKMAAKRMKSKLRKDLESTVVLLDSNIVSKDPKREERETSFSRAYLNKVKERFSSEPDRYIDFLGIFNSFSTSAELPVDELYHKICEVLHGNPDLIEDFTAFLPPDVALACGVLMENLEFAKARLFLRQVEVHFQKNPTQFQKVLTSITEWAGKENRTNNELKENIFPLLKGQPHLEQEFSLLFPDERPPDNYMMDFEEIVLDDEKEKEYDSFEEIEIPDSDEEIPITKSRVGRPPNKPPSSTQPPPGLRASALHGFLPNAKAALLKGRLPSILKSTSGGKKKSPALDPWQELNAHLQYGTQGCKCNCHEKSHDTRVQRKVRHCAYCSAMVTRTELISSLRGLTIANRRRGHLLSGSQQPGTSDDAPQRNSKRGSGRNPSGRKALKVQWAEAGDDQEMEEEEEEEEQNPYSDAVAHLSEICSNLADYLNENASLSEEDEEEEKESDDDDGNDDAEDGQEDDDYEDLEDEDEDKPEDEDEDDVEDDAVMTSEESHGVDGATPESSVSPVLSQGSHESCLSDSSGSRNTQQPAQLPSSQTTLLGSGVGLEGNGSRANSPVTYAKDERSTEEHLKELKSCLAKEKDEETMSNPSSVRSLTCHEILSDSPVRHFSAIGESSGQAGRSVSLSDSEKKDNVLFPQSDSSGMDSKSPCSVITAGSPAQVSASEKSVTSLPTKPTIRRVKTVRPTHIPDVPFGQRSKPVSLFESLAKSRPSPTEDDSLENPFKTEILKTEPEAESKNNFVESDQSNEPVPEKRNPEECKTELSGTVPAPEASAGLSEMPKTEEDSRAEQEKASGASSLLSAANVARRKDGEVVVVWTRDADRLLLQRCRDQGATEEVFEEVAKTLTDKSSEQVEQRFNTLMKLFQSASRDSEEDEESEEDASEDEENDQQESDSQDVDDNG